MNSDGFLVQMLLCAITMLGGLAVYILQQTRADLGKRLESQDKSIGRAHQRIDEHIADYEIHACSMKKKGIQ